MIERAPSHFSGWVSAMICPREFEVSQCFRKCAVLKKSVFTERVLQTYGWLATLPFRFRADQIHPPQHVAHGSWEQYLSTNFDKAGLRVLEIGSRNVTGANLRSKFSNSTYVGFDFYEGENVDIAGDVHRLSSYFSPGEKFDLIFSSAVFEHLHMPWVAAAEIQKMLKVGGSVFVETHFSFSSHERPWHFFQFSEMGLRALFNDSLGFDLIDSGMSNPIAGYYTSKANPELRGLPVAELYCHSEILCRKRCEVSNFEWAQVSIDGIVEGSRYPAPKP
jgi:Methyltransferase domain